MAKKRVLELLCFVDEKFRERAGPDWQIYLNESIRGASKIMEEAGITLKIAAAIDWPLPALSAKEWRARWKQHKKWSYLWYGDNYDEVQRKGIFVISVALEHLINLAWRREDVRPLMPKCIAIGFTGSLYWFDTKGQPLLKGGGLARQAARCFVVNNYPNQQQFIQVIAHELLHLFGISHSKRGIMRRFHDSKDYIGGKNSRLNPAIIKKLKNSDLFA